MRLIDLVSIYYTLTEMVRHSLIKKENYRTQARRALQHVYDAHKIVRALRLYLIHLLSPQPHSCHVLPPQENSYSHSQSITSSSPASYTLLYIAMNDVTIHSPILFLSLSPSPSPPPPSPPFPSRAACLSHFLSILFSFSIWLFVYPPSSPSPPSKEALNAIPANSPNSSNSPDS